MVATSDCEEGELVGVVAICEELDNGRRSEEERKTEEGRRKGQRANRKPKT